MMLVGCSGGQTPSELDTVEKATPTHKPAAAAETSGIVERLDLTTLTGLADTILVGRVSGTKSRWLDDNSQIVTEVTITVEEAVSPAGLSAKEIVVRAPGGTVGDVTQSSEDAPQFEVGERVLLFANAASDGTYKVTGGGQGKQTIEGELVQAWEMTLADALVKIRALKP
jgi:hypothetical protein